MQTYHDLKTRDILLDNNSCTVIASSIAFDVDYNEMLKHYDMQGRRRGRGVAPSETKRINLGLAKKYDYKAQVYERESIRAMAGGKTMTVNNCTKYLDPYKNYILGVRGHSLAVVDGDVQDHTEGKKNRVISLIELTRPKGKESTVCTKEEYDHLFGNKVQSVQSIEKMLAEADLLINFNK